MTPSRLLPGLAAGLAAAALVTGLAAAPAQASPGAAAKALATMKMLWGTKPPATQAALCRTWNQNRALTITSTVQAISLVPASSHLTRAETRSVAITYLRWACSGPGGTPRS